MTPLGAYIERRRRDLGFDSEVAFVQHIPRVNGGEGVSRGTLYNISTDPDISVQPRTLRRLARALADDLTDAAYERQLNALNELTGRPRLQPGELDVDPELIRQLGDAGRRYIEQQIKAIVQLRHDIWAERDDTPDEG